MILKKSTLSFCLKTVVLLCIINNAHAEQHLFAVPLSDLSTINHDVELFIDPYALNAQLIINNDREILLPDRSIPVRIFEISDKRMLVIAREFFKENIVIYLMDLDGDTISITTENIPKDLAQSIFRQALLIKDVIYIVVFNPTQRNHYLYKLNVDTDKIDLISSHSDVIPISKSKELDDKVFLTALGNDLYVCMRSECYIYDGLQTPPVITGQLSIDKKHTIVEIVSDNNNIFSLVQNQHYNADAHRWLNPRNWFKSEYPYAILNLKNNLVYKHLDAEQGIPYQLYFDKQDVKSKFASNEEQLIDLFLFDIQKNGDNGLLNIAYSNKDGRIAWSQTSYLNALINIMAYREHFDFFEPVYDDIKSRVDLELLLLNQLLANPDLGLISTRYTIDNQPAVFAVHSALVLRMFKRYLYLTEDPYYLTYYPALNAEVMNLTNHLESFSDPQNTFSNFTAPNRYLLWPKGAPVSMDGVGLPYNQQNAWAMGVAAFADSTQQNTSLSLQTAISVVEFFLENEGFNFIAPIDYNWFYQWGIGYSGWEVQDDVSLNTPKFKGHIPDANIAYRSLDAKSVLTLGQLHNELINNDLLTYFSFGVEEGYLHPVLIEELIIYDKVPELAEHVIYKHARFTTPMQLDNSIWAYQALSQSE